MEGKEPIYPVLIPRTGYSISEVIEYVEGGMNLEYTDPSLTWDEYEHTVDTFTIALTSGYASQVNLEALYEKVRDTASVFFYSISESDRFPYLFDVVNLFSTSSTLQISVLCQVGKIHRDPTPFGSTDYWSIFPDGGKCGPYSGSSGNASSKLNSALIDYFSPYGCVFYTDMTYVGLSTLQDYGWWDLNGDDPTPEDNVIDYRTFNTSCEDGSPECDEFFENGIYCLDPDEMNYYFQSIVSIYNDYMNEMELDHRTSGLYFDTGTGAFNHYFWSADNWFGVRHDCIVGGDFPHVLPFCCN